MSTPVRFRMSSTSVLKVPLHAVVVQAPDSFRPVIGDKIYLDYLKDGGGAILDTYVVAVEWNLEFQKPGCNTGYDLVMRVTLSTDKPPPPEQRRQVRKVHPQ
jgi:hypothetical protein